MRFLSVCSGIDAASVAWNPLGWEVAAFSEIEKFPAAVLSVRFPTVKNLGDMNKFKDWDIGKRSPIDVLVSGTPCQSFSVAGLRKGLDDPRGNLALVYCGILERFKPKWFVWENVPGVLSSGAGRDFGSFLGAVAKLGYGFAYRVLDAQFFGVPQRRRRVFVVGCLGDWRSAAAVLFERESMRRDSAKGGKKKQEIAGTLSSRTSAGGGLGADFELASGLQVAHALRGEGFDASEDGKGRGTPLVPVLSHACLAKGGSGRFDPSCETFVACTIPATDGGASSGMHPVVAFNARQDPDYSTNRTGPIDTDGTTYGITIHGTEKTQKVISQTTVAGAVRTKPPGSQENSSTTAVFQNQAVRRLTPRECERLQGFPDDWTLIRYRGKPAADGPRYKAIGNSMAVPVMRWIGERIDLVTSFERN